jgi:hypothetical protein
MERAIKAHGYQVAAALAKAADSGARQTAAAWHRARALRLALVICLLMLTLIIGVNWLINQPWGSGSGTTYTCTDGGTLHARNQGDKTILWCS